MENTAFVKIRHLFFAIENQNKPVSEIDVELKIILKDMKTEVYNAGYRTGINTMKKELNAIADKLTPEQ